MSLSLWNGQFVIVDPTPPARRASSGVRAASSRSTPTIKPHPFLIKPSHFPLLGVTITLGRAGIFSYTSEVIVLLRFASILNASIWCGAAVFVIIGLPAIFSPEVRHYLTGGYVGIPAQAILARFFILQYWCAGIAITHLLAERLYYGRATQKSTLWLLVGMACLALLGGLVLQPKLKELHRTKYWGPTVEQRAQAAKWFPLFHGVSESANILVAGGLIVYLWRVTKSTESSRFVGFNKIRS